MQSLSPRNYPNVIAFADALTSCANDDAYHTRDAVTASVVTRSVIGTLTATIGVVVAALVAAGFPAARDWSPATWVSAWTRLRRRPTS